MSGPVGFNIEDITCTPLTGGGGKNEPQIDRLVGKILRLQQGKRFLEDEVKGLVLVSESLEKELETCQIEAYQLEGIHKEKEDLCRKLQFQCQESEQNSVREVEQIKKNRELLEQYKCDIQEFKLKHRKQRIKFENQHHQLIEQHKNLYSVFTPERLPAEIMSAEKTISQLLPAEEQKLAQLRRLNEMLQEIKKPKERGMATAETVE